MSEPQLLYSIPYAWPLSGRWQAQECALLVIDMQQDFLCNNGYFSAMGESNQHVRQAMKPALQFLHFAREQGMMVIHTRESHRPELVDLNQNKRIKAQLSGSPVGSDGPLGRLLVRGEAGCDFHPDFRPAEGEIVVDKPGNSAFYATDLEHVLRVCGIRTLMLMGVTTDVCVSSTMRDANDRGYDCLLLNDCCGAATPALHESVLAGLERENGIFGAYADSTDITQWLQS